MKKDLKLINSNVNYLDNSKTTPSFHNYPPKLASTANFFVLSLDPLLLCAMSLNRGEI